MAFKNVPDILTSILNILFPPKCAVCGCFDNKIICGKCISEIKFINEVEKNILFITLYEGTMKKAIKKMKFRKKQKLGNVLGRIMAENIRFNDFDCVIPVPLHKNRLKERGFNQAELISRPIEEKFFTPIVNNVLLRVKETKRQFDLKRGERLVNVKGAFAVANADKIKDKKILLVDDIYTTGSTIKECMSCLSSNGAKSVYCLVLSRAIEL